MPSIELDDDDDRIYNIEHSESPISQISKLSKPIHMVDHKSQSLLACLPGQYKTSKHSETDSDNQSIIKGHAKINDIRNGNSYEDAVSSSSRVTGSKQVLKDVHKGFPSKRQMALNNLKQNNADGLS